ncbi:MAG: VanZ family protein [Firmicutes bacterium]|nr:VanZ family protein [Bacillota bacterium]
MERTLLCCAILIILLATLLPFSFQPYDPAQTVRQFESRFSMGGWDWLGLLANVILFFPFGFGAWMGLRDRYRHRVRLAAVGVLGSGLSAVCELLQLFLPGRLTSLLDLVANTVGALLGALCAWWGPRPVFDWLEARARRLVGAWVPTTLLRLSLTYLFAVSSVLMLLYPWSGRSTWTWDPSYSLMLGNEADGSRAWYGRIWRVEFADRAIDPKQVEPVIRQGLAAVAGPAFLGSYVFAPEIPTGQVSGVLPPLRWRGTTSPRVHESAVLLSQEGWLQTAEPAAVLTERVRRTNQFTLAVLCAPERLDQFGPARIVSLSLNTVERNFTLGQFGSHVTLRVRTPLTGPNATVSELHLREAFATLQPVHLLMTFDGARVRAWVNGVRSDAELNLRIRPGAALLSRVFFVSPYRIREFDALSLLILFVPTGLLLGMATAAWSWARRVVVLGVGALGLAVVPEVLTALLLEQPLLAGRLWLGAVLIVAGGVVGFVLVGDLARLRNLEQERALALVSSRSAEPEGY